LASCPAAPAVSRTSANSTSWEQAESIARQYETSAAGGRDAEAAMSLLTVKDAVDSYIADARARELVDETARKLSTSFAKQLLFIRFLRDLSTKHLSKWRSTSMSMGHPSPDFGPSGNVALQTFRSIVRLNRNTREREIVMMRWGSDSLLGQRPDNRHLNH
jgi:hypothetical protein